MSKMPAATGRGGKSLEQIYQKKTPLEHILLRPGTYVGSCEAQNDRLWVYNTKKEAMELKNISYVPALYKIFDEILVNAADHMSRDKKADTIKVTIDPDTFAISVWNNGSGLPVQIHKKEKIYIPELVFGNLLTSDNYDDSEKKTTGGRNGYGAKLANIFSTKFIIETADTKSKKKYKQVEKKLLLQHRSRGTMLKNKHNSPRSDRSTRSKIDRGKLF